MKFMQIVADRISCMPPEQLREWKEIHGMKEAAPVTSVDLSRLEQWTPEHREIVIAALQDACFRWESEPDTYPEAADIMEGLSAVDFRIARICSIQSCRSFLPWFHDGNGGREAALWVIEKSSRKIANRTFSGCSNIERLQTWVSNDDPRKHAHLASMLLWNLSSPIQVSKRPAKTDLVKTLVEDGGNWSDVHIVENLCDPDAKTITDMASFFRKKHARTIGEAISLCFDLIDSERQGKKR
jgi:hypothetical protein